MIPAVHLLMNSQEVIPEVTCETRPAQRQRLFLQSFLHLLYLPSSSLFLRSLPPSSSNGRCFVVWVILGLFSVHRHHDNKLRVHLSSGTHSIPLSRDQQESLDHFSSENAFRPPSSSGSWLTIIDDDHRISGGYYSRISVAWILYPKGFSSQLTTTSQNFFWINSNHLPSKKSSKPFLPT